MCEYLIRKSQIFLISQIFNFLDKVMCGSQPFVAANWFLIPWFMMNSAHLDILQAAYDEGLMNDQQNFGILAAISNTSIEFIHTFR